MADRGGGSGLSVHDLATRISLFEKLSAIHEKLLAGKLQELNVPHAGLQSLTSTATNGTRVHTMPSTPDARTTSMLASTPAGRNAQTTVANRAMSLWQATQTTANNITPAVLDDDLEDGEVEDTGPPAFESPVHTKSDILAQRQTRIEQVQAPHSQVFGTHGNELQKNNPRNLPWIDLPHLIAQAQASLSLLPDPDARSAKSFDTESLYSSRGSWSAQSSPPHPPYASGEQLTVAPDQRIEAIEISSNEDEFVPPQMVQALHVDDDNDYVPSQPGEYGNMEMSQSYAKIVPFAASNLVPQVFNRTLNGAGPATEPIDITSDDPQDYESPPRSANLDIYGSAIPKNDGSISSR